MLKAMHLDPHIICLIQGLVSNAKVKVHVNGMFTRPFPLDRGVRQGNPLSPILLSISLQPLMSMLEDRRAKGELTRLKILNQDSLLHQLFADDAGIFLQNLPVKFENARATIQDFENISWAILNVAKLVIIPLVNPADQV